MKVRCRKCHQVVRLTRRDPEHCPQCGEPIEPGEKRAAARLGPGLAWGARRLVRQWAGLLVFVGLLLGWAWVFVAILDTKDWVFFVVTFTVWLLAAIVARWVYAIVTGRRPSLDESYPVGDVRIRFESKAHVPLAANERRSDWDYTLGGLSVEEEAVVLDGSWGLSVLGQALSQGCIGELIVGPMLHKPRVVMIARDEIALLIAYVDGDGPAYHLFQQHASGLVEVHVFRPQEHLISESELLARDVQAAMALGSAVPSDRFVVVDKRRRRRSPPQQNGVEPHVDP